MINRAIDWVSDSLALLGVSPGDVLCIHGDAGVAAQIRSVGNRPALQQLFDAIEAYLGINGTLVIPSFTYSATKNLIYDPISTPSEVGMFSEAFRQRTNISRSLNTIFSVCASGKYAKDFRNSRADDCFGSGTAFDLLYKSNALILTMGFDIKKGVTFTHYVEQRFQVQYRYMKEFVGKIRCENGKIQNQHITYYVRDQSFPSTCNLEYFGKRARVAGKLVEVPFGRFPATSIRAQDFFNVATMLLRENKFSLLTCYQENS
jgi:aminoglycoside 3-N-acetyltransferase